MKTRTSPEKQADVFTRKLREGGSLDSLGIGAKVRVGSSQQRTCLNSESHINSEERRTLGWWGRALQLERPPASPTPTPIKPTVLPASQPHRCTNIANESQGQTAGQAAPRRDSRLWSMWAIFSLPQACGLSGPLSSSMGLFLVCWVNRDPWSGMERAKSLEGPCWISN